MLLQSSHPDGDHRFDFGTTAVDSTYSLCQNIVLPLCSDSDLLLGLKGFGNTGGATLSTCYLNPRSNWVSAPGTCIVPACEAHWVVLTKTSLTVTLLVTRME